MRGRVFFLGAAVFVFSTASFAQVSITGAGATFPGPLYAKWFDDYHRLHSTVQISYGGGGSGAGIKRVSDGTVDFGASDAPMSDQEIADFRAKQNRGIL